MSILKNFTFLGNGLSAVFSTNNFVRISTPHIRLSSPIKIQQLRSFSRTFIKYTEVMPETQNIIDRGLNRKSLNWAKNTIFKAVQKNGFLTPTIFKAIITDLHKQKIMTVDHSRYLLYSMKYLTFSNPKETTMILDLLAKDVTFYPDDLNTVSYFEDLIFCYNRFSKGVMSDDMLHKMELANVKPSRLILKELIHSLCQNKKLDEALQTVNYMKSQEMIISPNIHAHIVYCKCLLGESEEAINYFLEHKLEIHPRFLNLLYLGFAESGDIDMLKTSINRFSSTHNKWAYITDSFASRMFLALLKIENGKHIKFFENLFPVFDNPIMVFSLLTKLKFHEDSINAISPFLKLEFKNNFAFINATAKKICEENKSFEEVNAAVSLFKGQSSYVKLHYFVLFELVMKQNLKCVKEILLKMHREKIPIKSSMILPILCTNPPLEFVKDLKQVCNEINVDFPEKMFVSLKLTKSDTEKHSLKYLASYFMAMSEDNHSKKFTEHMVSLRKKYNRSAGMKKVLFNNFLILGNELNNCTYEGLGKNATSKKKLLSGLHSNLNSLKKSGGSYVSNQLKDFSTKKSVADIIKVIDLITHESNSCESSELLFDINQLCSEILTFAFRNLFADDYDKVLHKVSEIPNITLSDGCVNQNIWHFISTGNEEQVKALEIPADLPSNYAVSFIPECILRSGHPNTLALLEKYLERAYGKEDAYWILFSSFLQHDMMNEVNDLIARYKNIVGNSPRSGLNYITQCVFGLSQKGILKEKCFILWDHCQNKFYRQNIFDKICTELSSDVNSLTDFLNYAFCKKNLGNIISRDKILAVFLEHKVLPPVSFQLGPSHKQLFQLLLQEKLDLKKFSEIISNLTNDEKIGIPFSILTAFYCKVIDSSEWDTKEVKKITNDLKLSYLPYRQAGILEKKLQKLVEEDKVEQAVQFISDNFQLINKNNRNVELWKTAVKTVCKAAVEKNLVRCVFDLGKIIDASSVAHFANINSIIKVHLTYLHYKLNHTLPKKIPSFLLKDLVKLVKNQEGDIGIKNLKQAVLDKSGSLDIFVHALLAIKEFQQLGLKIIEEEKLTLTKYVSAYNSTTDYEDFEGIDKIFREQSGMDQGFLNRCYLWRAFNFLPNSQVTPECLSERYFSAFTYEPFKSIAYPRLIHHLQFNAGENHKIKIRRDLLKLKKKLNEEDFFA